MRKRLHNIDFSSVMHPDDKKKVEWLNNLKVPYLSKWDFTREIAKHPLDHDLKTWHEFTDNDIFYVTREKKRTKAKVMETKEIPEEDKDTIVNDKVVELS